MQPMQNAIANVPRTESAENEIFMTANGGDLRRKPNTGCITDLQKRGAGSNEAIPQIALREGAGKGVASAAQRHELEGFGFERLLALTSLIQFDGLLALAGCTAASGKSNWIGAL
jgi:hypothetical protein